MGVLCVSVMFQVGSGEQKAMMPLVLVRKEVSHNTVKRDSEGRDKARRGKGIRGREHNKLVHRINHTR